MATLSDIEREANVTTTDHLNTVKGADVCAACIRKGGTAFTPYPDEVGPPLEPMEWKRLEADR